MSTRTIVLYYSRTGNTKKVAEFISYGLGCESTKILDKKDRSGLSGYIRGGWDAWRENRTDIGFTEDFDPSRYDLLVVGTPVWAGKPSPAVRTFITDLEEKVGDIAFFCTLGGTGDKTTFQKLEELYGEPPVASVAVTEKELNSNTYKKKIKNFVEKCLKV